MSERQPAHFTTRRAFVAASGFSVASLYLLWAGYGAAPLGLGGHSETAEDDGAHGGAHGEASSAAAATAEFKRQAQEFIERNKLPDGSVRPRGMASTEDDHAGHGMPHGLSPIDVYLMAYQWVFAPSVLRLEAGVPYRFRMMALDVAHGASLQLGVGARIVRLRPGALVVQEYTFARPGEYLLYCTVYCGLPHDRMQGRLIVAEAEAGL